MDDLRMEAYYFGFDLTGVRAVDEVLSAVAWAGKAYHSTEMWGDAYAEEGVLTEASKIQAAARSAAEKFAALTEERDKYKRVADLARELRVMENAVADLPTVSPSYEGMCVQRAAARQALDAALAALEEKS
jgi:hypothetical protein